MISPNSVIRQGERPTQDDWRVWNWCLVVNAIGIVCFAAICCAAFGVWQ